MARPILLADMNISPQTIASLRQAGWDILRVSEVLSAAASDREILEFARTSSRAIVTQDLDFSALLGAGGHDRPSVVTLRTTLSDPETITSRLMEVLPLIEANLHRGCIASIDDSRVLAVGWLAAASLEWPYPPLEERPTDCEAIVVLSGYAHPPKYGQPEAELGEDTYRRCGDAAWRNIVHTGRRRWPTVGWCMGSRVVAARTAEVERTRRRGIITSGLQS